MRRYQCQQKASPDWPRSRQALAIIAASSGIKRGDIARAMGCAPATVAIYCNALRAAGLARATGIGRGSLWVAA